MARISRYRRLLRAQRKQLWLRRHGASESVLTNAIKAWFARLHKTALQRLDDGADAASLIDVAAATDSLLAAVAAPMTQLSVGAAIEEISTHAVKTKAAKEIGVEFDEYDEEAEGGIPESWLDEVPPAVLAAIQAEIGEALKQPYWSELSEKTAADLQSKLTAAIESGRGLEAMIAAVKEALGPPTSDRRARTIARTETTGALNAGHHFARVDLIEQGLITGIEWLTVPDSDRRETHAALEGVIVGASEKFNVGGYEAPFPGHWSLPARERVNCRCFTIVSSTFVD